MRLSVGLDQVNELLGLLDTFPTMFDIVTP